MKTLKNLSLICIFLLGTAFSVAAQKFAYVDTKYILLHIPEYAEAQSELNRLSAEWQSEIENKYSNAQRLEEAFAAEKILLTSEMKKKREEDIRQKKQEAMEMQKQKFGVEGELFNKREELIKPIQDQIFEAIKEVSSSRGYMVIFDKANQSNMLYANPKHDVSDRVIKKMGLKPGDMIEQPEKEEEGKQEGSKSGAKPSGGKDNGAGNRGTQSKGGSGTVPAKRK